ASVQLAALRLAPDLAQAWLHWGLALMTWAKDAKQQQPSPTQPTPPQEGGVVIRHGGHLEAELGSCLDRSPPGVWQGLAPQLFAQLQHKQPGVRRLVLRLVQQVAAAAPFAVLYPALAEVQAAQRAGAAAAEEVQVLLHGLEENYKPLYIML
ncbi:uncharacterized protein HaLaN_30537, partial [Haematococcus lacustris]